MATALILRINGTTSTGDLPWLGTTFRAGLDTGTSNATTQIPASMIELLPTDANGIPFCWVTGYVAAPFTLAGQVDFSINAQESVSTVNVSLRAKVGKIPADASRAMQLVLSADYSTELATGGGDRTWSGTPGAAVDFELNSRIVVMILFRNFGTAAAGTAQITNDNQNSMTLTENVTFSETPIFNPIRSVPILGQPRPLF